MTDELLLNEASTGNREAFIHLYELHRVALFRFAYRLMGSSQLAEDIVHDCFLAVLTQPCGFDETRGTLRSYLLGAVRNLALKRHRLVAKTTGSDELDTQYSCAALEPLGELLEVEMSAAVQRAVAMLPHLQRESLLLFYYEELSLAEIAQITAVDVNTIKARLFRARQRLKAILQPYMADGTSIPQAAMETVGK